MGEEALLWQRRKRTARWWAGARRKLRRTMGRHGDCVVGNEVRTEDRSLLMLFEAQAGR